MASVTTDTRLFEEYNNNDKEVNRQEIQAAIAKAVELRALHAALMQANSPSNNNNNNNNNNNILRFPMASSPANSLHASHFSAQDYPVFTPSYEDEPLSGYHQNSTRSRTLSEIWDEYGLGVNVDETVLSDYYKKEASPNSRIGLPSDSANLEPHICSAEDNKSVPGSCANPITGLQASLRRRNGSVDSMAGSSCNRCRPATITSESEAGARNRRACSNIVVPLTDSHSSAQPQRPKSRGVISWLFPRLKKKKKQQNEAFSPVRTESEEASQILRDSGIMTVETLKRELIEAHQNRDSALLEVSEMKSSLGELRHKLESLETYCEELKKALRQATAQAKTFPGPAERGKSVHGNDAENNPMPVSEEVMVEGFLQIVSEARLSVRHFCKTLIGQIEETDTALADNLNAILEPHKLSLNLKYSKAVLYHLEAIINQTMYQDFENHTFQKNGPPRFLDPEQDRQAQFGSFVALRNLSWNEVLRKGTKFYSEELSKFCDQKMSLVISALGWTRPWSEQLLQAFFVAAKCIWLLHLLAFSFDPPVAILRVEENWGFDAHYMDDVLVEGQRSGSGRVKIMVVPGFYVRDRVLRCKVLCRYKSAGCE